MCTLEQAYQLNIVEFRSRLWSVCLFLASTTVNVTHRPVTQTAAKLPIPRAPANHQVVYTTLPAPPAQTPVRGAVMPSPGLRPVNPQTGGRGCFLHAHFSTTQLGMFYLMDVGFGFGFVVLGGKGWLGFFVGFGVFF